MTIEVSGMTVHTRREIEDRVQYLLERGQAVGGVGMVAAHMNVSNWMNRHVGSPFSMTPEPRTGCLFTLVNWDIDFEHEDGNLVGYTIQLWTTPWNQPEMITRRVTLEKS